MVAKTEHIGVSKLTFALNDLTSSRTHGLTITSTENRITKERFIDTENVN